MPEAYIVDALRSPTGRRKGGLSQIHAADLGAHVLRALVERNGIPDHEYDDVIFGCVDTIGPLAGDIARTSWLAAGLSQAVPGTTIDRQCGSSQQAVHFAAQAVMSGTQDVVIAGGVQTMTQIPISSAMTAAEPLGFSDPFSGSEGWVRRYGKQPPTQFKAAQMIAEKWGLSREALEAYALESHQRALRAIDEGRFAREIVPLAGVEQDETPRQTTLAKMAELDFLFGCDRVTAAVSSQTCDAASALLIVSEAALKRYDLTPRARIHHISVRADDPIWMLTAPIPATEYALKRAGMRLDDIDRVEI
ncbi:acetyl-CoA C-acyltransferase, partial [Pseudomonas sp. CrR25]|nr:acetyl-CoA C-acyltransferase [Pseudomonas sp. CrR25]